MSLTRLAWRSLAARRLRSLLTITGIALGVGVLFASLATSASIESSIDRTVTGLVGRADLRVAAFQERGLSEITVRDIEITPGVAAAAPVVERRTYLPVPIGAPSLPPPVTVLGIDPELDPLIHDRVILEGAALSRPDEATVVISETLARADGYGLGSELTIQGGGALETFRVVGILAGDGPLVASAGRTVLMPVQAASRVFGLRGVSWVDVAVGEGSTAADVEAALVSTLASEPYVLSTPRDLAATLRASTSDFQATTALISAVALFVAALLIFNTVSMTLGERIREVGLLRAAGATRRQAMAFVLSGAVALGAIGSLVGLVAGLAMAALVSGRVVALSTITIDRLETSPVSFVIAAVVGMAVTIAAALEPAWRASRISPIETLKARGDPGAGRSARLRWLSAVFAAVALAGLVVWPNGAGDGGVARATVVYAILLAATLLSPFLLRPLSRLAGVPFAAILGFEERLARGSLVRDRSRAAVTVGALTIGLAMIVAIGGVAQTMRSAASAWIAGVVPGQEIVTSIRPVRPEEGVLQTLAAIPGVERVTPIASFDAAYRGRRLDAVAVVGADFLADGRLAFLAGDRTAALTGLDAGGTAVLPRSQAERLGAVVGSSLRFAVGDGRTVSLAVTGIVERGLPGDGGEAMFVGWPDATAAFGVGGADYFAVRFASGPDAAARQALRTEARTLALEVSTLAQIQGAISDALGRVFGLFDALAVVAVIVAALGIVNTLTMNVVERVREIGVLRATGMTRRQVGRMVTVEAGIVGLTGALLGSVIGLAAGWAMVEMAGVRTTLPADLPWSAVAVAFGLGLGASMLAAYYPARLAGRLSIVRAVQFD